MRVKIALTTALLMSTLPVQASTLDLGRDIVEIFDSGGEFENLLEDALGYALGILGAEIGNDCPDIMRIVPGPCPNGGIGGIEDIILEDIPKTSGGYRTTSLPGAEFFNSNPTIIDRDFANLYDQEYARAQAANLLGENGSDWIDKNVGITASLVQENELLSKEVEDLTKEAHTLEVTQDVMKNSIQVQSHLSKISLNQTRLNAQMQASLLALQQQQASVMQLSANLGEALDENNRRERLERDAIYWQEGRSVIFIPGFKLSER